MAKIREPNANITAALEKHSKALETIDTTVKEEYEIPSGYIPIELSTHGLLGAPKRFHTRNFDTSDLLNLALSEDDELPEKVAKMLDNLILEEEVSAMNFHEKEVVEYLARLYQAFFANTLKDIEFPWDDTDLEFLETKYGGRDSAAAKERINDLKVRRWVPKIDIDLSKVETYDLDPATFKTKIFLTDKATGFKAGFSYPRYGDVVVLRNFLLQVFREQDKQYSNIRDVLKFRRDAQERILKGEEISLARLPNIPDVEKDKYRQYETEKSIFSAVAIKALHLIQFDGKDVSKAPLKDRIELAKDPRVDYKMMKTVNEFYDTMKIGLKEDILMVNPIKGVEEARKYSFRLIDLLQAARMAGNTQFDIEFESEDIE